LLSAFGLIFIPLALGANFHDWASVNIGNIALDASAQAFVGSVIVWGIGASAQTPALIALAQQNAPKGSEATALALPKAFGDGTYIVVPFLLGLVTDTFSDLPGSECAAAGAASLLGVMTVGLWCEDR
jgi:MFS-type transporter involved in bile tolerance (Atg22 family)